MSLHRAEDSPARIALPVAIRDAGPALLVLAVLLVPWWVRQASAKRIKPPPQTATLVAPELSYRLWYPSEASQTLRAVQQNAFRSLFGLAYFQFALPAEWVVSAVQDASWGTIALHVLCYLLGAFILVGFLSSAQSGWRALHVYAVAYAAMMLAWPFEPYRFLIPWTPFLLYFLLNGAAVAFSRFLPIGNVKRSGSTTASSLGTGVRRPGLTAALVVGAALAVLFAIDNMRVLRSTDRSYYLREFSAMDWAELRDLERWIHEKTARADVIASPLPAALYLTTGRQGHYFWPDTDPYSLYYGPDRRYASLYAAPSESEMRHAQQGVRKNLLSVYERAGIDYCILQRGIGPEPEVRQLFDQQPECFTLCYQTPRDTFAVYRSTAQNAE